jgi:hypothetical protein
MLAIIASFSGASIDAIQDIVWGKRVHQQEHEKAKFSLRV